VLARRKDLITGRLRRDETERNDLPADGSSARSPTVLGRRELLAASGVVLAGCAALGGGGASYERSDLELAIETECAGDGS